jgi:hypothetical protein
VGFAEEDAQRAVRVRTDVNSALEPANPKTDGELVKIAKRVAPRFLSD